MLLYANGDSHTASWSYIDVIGENFGTEFVNQAINGTSNASIIRRTREYLKHTRPDLIIIGWSTWEREEWLIDDILYQINASGTDHVPVSHQEQYKDYISNINWQQKTRDAHEAIWNFHQDLESVGVKHIFFNGNNDFSKIEIQKDWGTSYIGPYDPASTYDAIVSEKCETVSPTSYHYGPDGHRVWAQFLTKYIVDNKLI